MSSRPLAARVIAPFALLACFACDDGTGPSAQHVDVTIAASSDWNSYGTDQGTRVWCRVFLTANAYGRGSATWQDGVLRRFVGPDRSVPFDSVYFAVGVVRQIMGQEIRAGAAPNSGFQFELDAPASFSAEFRYEVDGAVFAAPFAFHCGPAIDPEVPVHPPAVTSLEFSAEQIQPGDEVIVRYEAASRLGIWNVNIEVGGAVSYTRRRAGALATSLSDSISVQIPPHVALGDSITVRVTVTDAVFQSSVDTIVSRPIVDLTSPVGRVTLSGWCPNVGCQCAQGLCQFGTGDTLTFIWDGSDNSASGRLFWEIGDPVIAADSAALPLRTSSGIVRVHVPPEWLGVQPVRAWVSDESGNSAGLVLDDTFRVYPVVAATRYAGSLPMEYLHGGAAADFARGRLYLLDGGVPRIFVLSLPTLAIIDQIPLPGTAGGLALSSDGRSLVVTQPVSHDLLVLDPLSSATFEVVEITAVSPAPDMGLSDVVITSEGDWLALFEYSGYGAESESVVMIDRTAGGQSVVRGPAVLGGLFGSADGSVVYLAERANTWDFAACMRRLYGDGTYGSCAESGVDYPALHAESLSDGSRWATQAGLFDQEWQRIGEPLGGAEMKIPAGSAAIYDVGAPALRMIDPSNDHLMLRTQPFQRTGVVADLVASPAGRWILMVTADRTVSVDLFELP